MDISNFSSKKTADTGKWFKVVLYDNVDCGFWLNILGDDSDTVQAHGKEQFKKLSSKAGNKKVDDETINEIFNSDIENVIVRLNGIAGNKKTEIKEGKKIKYIDEPDVNDKVILFDRELNDDSVSYAYLIEQIPAIKKFVLDKAKERTNFLFQKKEN